MAILEETKADIVEAPQRTEAAVGTRVGHLEVFVPDPMRAKDFYVHILGFEVGEVQHEGKVVWLAKDDFTLLLRPGQPDAAPRYQEAATAIVLYTDDLDAEVKSLKNRGLVFKGTDGSDRCLTFTDPDGNWFQLVNPQEQ
ncbi:MAG: VOC family protein [Planctomycetia bacterium]|nr:VOC family protein [Planctomycetia bacterium]